MSGGGGYFTYRCKYWMSHDCESWVWVNGTACINCLALGRESDQTLIFRTIDMAPGYDLPRIGLSLLREANARNITGSSCDRRHGWEADNNDDVIEVNEAIYAEIMLRESLGL